MAALYPMDTPDRLLKRVQQLEDMELPSLPSFQHDDDIDYDSESGTGSDNSGPLNITKDVSTPHPLRKSFLPPSTASRSSGTISESSAGSPFPPLDSRNQTPSPYAPTTALTSTPHTIGPKTGIYSSDLTRTTFRPSHGRTKSGNTDLASSTNTKSQAWQTPGEFSQSFSASDINVDDLDELSRADEQSATEDRATPESQATRPVQTPLTRRLSNGNVTLNRRGNKSMSNTFQPLQPVKEVFVPSPITSGSETPSSPGGMPTSPDDFASLGQDRIPSLSRSEVSASEQSDAASTPEGPSRNPHIATPRDHRAGSVIPSPARRINWSQLQDEAEETSSERSHDDTYDSDTQQYENTLPAPSLGSLIQADIASPAKPPRTPGYSTPGIARLDSRNASPGDFMPTPRPGPLREASPNLKTPVNPPFTPSPGSATSKFSDPSTPRAPLDDGERRKSHVLAVLSSTGVPARVFRKVKGTPHPLRRVSTAHTTDSISEDGSGSPGGIVHQDMTPALTSRLADTSYAASNDQSFVSVASSADLTSDRRATAHKGALARGNTSFPTILLPTGYANASSPASLRGLGESRADGIKIHKHLNAMNKQLLETNADLAREAEVWKGEVDRLMGILGEAGIDVEEMDVAGQFDKSNLLTVPQHMAQPSNLSGAFSINGDSSAGSRVLAHISAMRGKRGLTPSGESSFGDMVNQLSKEDQQAVLEEMAERLEQLEIGLDEKDQLIAQLEEDLARASAGNEQSTSPEVEDLKQMLAEAEAAKASIQSDFAIKTAQHAEQFGDICQGFEDQIKELEAKLATAEGNVERLQLEKEDRAIVNSDKDESSDVSAIITLQARLEESRAGCLTQAAEIRVLQAGVEADLEKYRTLSTKAEDAENRLLEAQAKIDKAHQLEEEVEELKAAMDELLAEKEAQTNADELHELRTAKEGLEREIQDRDDQLQNLAEKFAQLEEDMQQAEADDKAAEQELLAEVQRLTELLAETTETLASKDAELESARAQAPTAGLDAGHEPVEVMEAHLEDAFKEIGRLKQQLAASPHLKSTLELRETKIQTLEREKAALQERLAGMREGTPSGMLVTASPFKATPFVNKAIASLRMPKTPGTLQELSWLQTTVGDANEPILRAQIDQLQVELDNANGQLDSNFSRLEAAGLNGLRLAEDLAQAQERINELEDQLRTLTQRNKASLALLTEQRDERARDGDQKLKEAMDAVHRQMEGLQSDLNAERSRLQKENARLTSMVSELRKDHAMDLQAVRSEADRDLAESANTLRRTRGDLVTAQRERDSIKKELHAMSAHVRELEVQLATQKAEYEALSRRQASMATSSELDSARRGLAQLQRSYDAAQSDVASLRRKLSDRDIELQNAQSKVDEMKAERQELAKDLKVFERDLREQQVEAEQIGRELRELKEERGGEDPRLSAELSRVKRESKMVQEKLRMVERDLKDAQKAHQTALSRQSQIDVKSALEDQKAKFKVQIQELAVQIRYLKAKFTREATFRNGLSLQKRYLLLLVGGMSLNEQATLKQIASMGFPVPSPPRTRRTLKAVGIAVLSTIKARNAAAKWKAERQIKSEVVLAREERKRITG